MKNHRNCDNFIENLWNFNNFFDFLKKNNQNQDFGSHVPIGKVWNFYLFLFFWEKSLIVQEFRWKSLKFQWFFDEKLPKPEFWFPRPHRKSMKFLRFFGFWKKNHRFFKNFEKNHPNFKNFDEFLKNNYENRSFGSHVSIGKVWNFFDFLNFGGKIMVFSRISIKIIKISRISMNFWRKITKTRIFVPTSLGSRRIEEILWILWNWRIRGI